MNQSSVNMVTTDDNSLFLNVLEAFSGDKLNVELDDSAFLRTQSYITEICYFEFLWSFEFWLAPHWDFFSSKDPPIYPNTHTVDQIQN